MPCSRPNSIRRGSFSGRLDGASAGSRLIQETADGSEPAIAFNPHYLLDGLTAAAAPVLHTRAGQPAEGEEPAAIAGGRVRIEFTSPAKPALITWTADSERDGVPAFRYLLVPLRVPERS